MTELLVVGFKGKHRAAEILNQLLELNVDWRIDLRDAVAVYRTDDGKMRFDQSVQPTTGEGAAAGGVLGGLLGGLLAGLLAAPITGGASIPAATAAALGVSGVALGATTGALIGADDAATWKEDYGISDDFVRQVAGMVQPGQSAVFVLARAASPEAIAERFRGYGGTVLRTTLPAAKAKKLQELLAARREPALS
jgi:uncharacterized membrane protein